MSTQIKHGAIVIAALAAAAGNAVAGVEGNTISFSAANATTGQTWATGTVAGQFLDDDTYVATIDLSSYSFDSGDGVNGIVFGGGDFISYMIQGENLRMGGGAQTVNLNFNVSAGFSNTSFSLSASPVVFAPFAVATGTASATVGITASGNPFSAPGVTFSPDGPGSYSALYNSGGSVFSDLFTSSVSIPGPGSATFTDNFAGALFGSVGDIGSEWNFILTARDQATGVSTFTVVPAPGAAALLGLGGLLAARRRR